MVEEGRKSEHGIIIVAVLVEEKWIGWLNVGELEFNLSKAIHEPLG